MIVFISKLVAVISVMILAISIIMILAGILGAIVIAYAFAQYYGD